MNILIETERLYLRELNINDFEDLSEILTDSESMQFYPKPFNRQKVKSWINWNIDNYKKYNHGLWAVILKDRRKFIGECGITIQDIEGVLLPELGYHINKKYWNLGYATEAAKGCMDYALNNLGFKKIYTYTDSRNIPSMKVAEKNGMVFVKSFNKTIMGTIIKEVLYSREL